jgi:Trk K+ transport system NAD-binding subunit
MYILVIGCSELGYHLTKALLASGHEVMVVEKSQVRCDILDGGWPDFEN